MSKGVRMVLPRLIFYDPSPRMKTLPTYVYSSWIAKANVCTETYKQGIQNSIVLQCAKRGQPLFVKKNHDLVIKEKANFNHLKGNHCHF